MDAASLNCTLYPLRNSIAHPNTLRYVRCLAAACGTSTWQCLASPPPAVLPFISRTCSCKTSNMFYYWKDGLGISEKFLLKILAWLWWHWPNFLQTGTLLCLAGFNMVPKQASIIWFIPGWFYAKWNCWYRYSKEIDFILPCSSLHFFPNYEIP